MINSEFEASGDLVVEIAQGKKLIQNLKKQIRKPHELIEKRPDLCLPEVEGGMEGDLEESGQKVQTCFYKINKC